MNHRVTVPCSRSIGVAVISMRRTMPSLVEVEVPEKDREISALRAELENLRKQLTVKGGKG